VIARIVGWPLDLVSFAADGYLQLWFGLYPLTSYAPVSIERGGERWAIPEPGARDALCASLGVDVVCAEADEERILIGLADGTQLHFALGGAPPGEEYAVELDDPDIEKRVRWRRPPLGAPGA